MAMSGNIPFAQLCSSNPTELDATLQRLANFATGEDVQLTDLDRQIFQYALSGKPAFHCMYTYILMLFQALARERQALGGGTSSMVGSGAQGMSDSVAFCPSADNCWTSTALATGAEGGLDLGYQCEGERGSGGIEQFDRPEDGELSLKYGYITSN